MKVESNNFPVDILIKKGLNEIPDAVNYDVKFKNVNSFLWTSDNMPVEGHGLIFAVAATGVAQASEQSYEISFVSHESANFELHQLWNIVYKASAEPSAPSPNATPKPGFEHSGLNPSEQPRFADPSLTPTDLCMSDEQYIFLGAILGCLVTLMYWPMARMCERAKAVLYQESD